MKTRILFLSWRDFYNPKKGGAEVALHQVFSRLVKKDYEVTWFSPLFPNARPEETLEGIKYLRQGNFFTIHREAINFYKKNKDKFDIVIDDLHGYPFLTNLYMELPTLTSIHEVAGVIWFQMWALPIALVGFLSERIFYRLLKGQKLLTVSESTKNDLVKAGQKAENIHILNWGINTKRVSSLDYKKNPLQICFLGRVCKMKGVTELLEAFSIARKTESKLKLVLIGRVDPDYQKELDETIAKYDLKDSVTVTGFVSDEEREKLFKESMFLTSCSVKEGFGLIVLEANAIGTPAITYDVNGYRDIIENGKTGYLVTNGDTEGFAQQILDGIKSKDYKKIQKNAFETSKKYNWEDCVKDFEEQLANAIKTQKNKPRPSLFARFTVKSIFTLTSIAGKILQVIKLA